jgi:hypothetical protein
MLYSYRRLIDVQYAASLTGSRAYSTGKFRKVVGRGQNLISLLPIRAVYSVVEIRNLIA